MLVQTGDALATGLKVELQRALDGDAVEAEGAVVEDLDLRALLEVGIEAGQCVDVAGSQLPALVAEGLAHLAEVGDAVDELDLAAALGGLAVGKQPDVGADAGVVEHLVR